MALLNPTTLRVAVPSSRDTFRRCAISAFSLLFLAPPALSCTLYHPVPPPSTSVVAPCSGADALYRFDRFNSDHFTSSGPLYSPDFTSSGTPPATSAAPEPRLGTALRAGIIEEIPAEPDLPKVTAGSVTWAYDRARAALIASFTITAWRGEVIMTAQGPPDGKFLRFNIRLDGPGPTSLNLAPRVRRTGAAEGEPLIGRVTRNEPGLTVFETSGDRLEHANNLARLTGSPWLDLILRSDTPQLVLTLERARQTNVVLSELLSR